MSVCVCVRVYAALVGSQGALCRLMSLLARKISERKLPKVLGMLSASEERKLSNEKQKLTAEYKVERVLSDYFRRVTLVVAILVVVVTLLLFISFISAPHNASVRTRFQLFILAPALLSIYAIKGIDSCG